MRQFRPKKSLGQNFLKNPQILPDIIGAAEIIKDDIVLEIGPGTGILTEALLKEGAKVYTIEKDFDLIVRLRQKFGNNKNLPRRQAGLKIVHQDALFFDETILKNYKVVSNLPFNVASPLIRKFLESSNPPELMVIMIQKEVAERIMAKPGDSNRGLLTVMVEFYADAQKIAIVSKNNFYPQPKVDAEIIKIDLQDKETRRRREIQPRLFFKLVKAGFSAKRKMLHNSLTATLRLPKDTLNNIFKKSQNRWSKES